jgi:hypothetical protein
VITHPVERFMDLSTLPDFDAFYEAVENLEISEPDAIAGLCRLIGQDPRVVVDLLGAECPYGVYGYVQAELSECEE